MSRALSRHSAPLTGQRRDRIVVEGRPDSRETAIYLRFRLVGARGFEPLTSSVMLCQGWRAARKAAGRQAATSKRLVRVLYRVPALPWDDLISCRSVNFSST